MHATSAGSRRVTAAGVDTWSVCWYVGSDSTASRALSGLATLPGARSKLLPPESIRGYRVGWFPGVGLAFAEGHPSPDGLCPPRQLGQAFESLVEDLADLGLAVPRSRVRKGWTRRSGTPVPDGFAGIRRLDLTADLAFSSASEGLAVLAGVAAMPLPRIATSLQRQPGGRAIETVYLKGPGGKRILARCYDKAVEQGQLAQRGTLIRPEDQRRFDGRVRPPVEAVGPVLTRELFQRRFLPLWKATEGITVATAPELIGRVVDLHRNGKISPRQATSLLAHLAADSQGVSEDLWHRSTVYRRRGQCRELGLVLADGTIDEVEVDLHSVIEAALEAEDWYAG